MKKFWNEIKLPLTVIAVILGGLAVGAMLCAFAEYILLFIGIIPMAIAFLGGALKNGGNVK